MLASKTRIARAQERLARLREASERIADPEAIQAKLDGLQPGQKNVLWKLYRASRSELTVQELAIRKELLANLKATAKGIESDIYSVFSSLGKDNWTLANVKKIGRYQALLDQIHNRVGQLGEEMKSTLSDGLLDRFKKTWADGAYRLDSVTPESIGIRFGLFPDREILALVNEEFNGGTFSDRLGLITDDMAQDIKSQLVQSMMAGESWQDAARRIRAKMGAEGARAVWRSEMIARTELANVQVKASRYLAQENSDVVDDVIFIAHPWACDICMEKHGRPVSEVGYPIEDTHPNCACDILIVPKGWDKLAAPTGDADDAPEHPVAASKWKRDNGLGGTLE